MSHDRSEKKILVISPGIEDGGMRGLGRVTFAIIDSLSDLGYETYLLTGAPLTDTTTKDEIKNITLKRSIDHYLAEGIKSNAFNLKRTSLFKFFIIESLRLLFGNTTQIQNKNIMLAQHEPLAVRQFSKVEVFVNFSLIYKISNKLPQNIRSLYFFAIAKAVKADAIVSASPYPISHPLVFGKKIKLIQSLHDVMPLNILETPPDSSKKFAKDFFIAMKSADLVLTSSNNAKTKLNTLLPETPVKVIYVPCVPMENKESIYSNKIIGINKKMGTKYILFMSALEKRKNVSRLIEAFNLIQELTNYKLVLVGSPGYGYDEIEESLNKIDSKTRENIILKGYVSEEEKWSLISGASIIAHPAIDEGLGIPVIEALIAKRPIVATRLRSLEEFVPKDSCVYVEDPYDVAEIADKLLFAIHNLDHLRGSAIKHSKTITKFFSKKSFSRRLGNALDSVDF